MNISLFIILLVHVIKKSLIYFRTNSLCPIQICAYTKKSAEEKLGIEKPKRPLTPFFKFMTQMRPALLAKNPGISSKEAIAWSSKHWQELDSEVYSLRITSLHYYYSLWLKRSLCTYHHHLVSSSNQGFAVDIRKASLSFSASSPSFCRRQLWNMQEVARTGSLMRHSQQCGAKHVRNDFARLLAS